VEVTRFAKNRNAKAKRSWFQIVITSTTGPSETFFRHFGLQESSKIIP
jgi:hypothetical protein